MATNNLPSKRTRMTKLMKTPNLPKHQIIILPLKKVAKRALKKFKMTRLRMIEFSPQLKNRNTIRPGIPAKVLPFLFDVAS